MNQHICEAIVKGYTKKPEILHGIEDIPCYYVDKDIVQLSDYTDPAKYYRDLFHELIHSTGHPSRLNRETILAHNYFNFHEDYGTVEELTATFGEIMLCHLAGIPIYETEKTIKECFKCYDIKQKSVKAAKKYALQAFIYILKN